jgi:pentose-5-phosphate-3-epimerase
MLESTRGLSEATILRENSIFAASMCIYQQRIMSVKRARSRDKWFDNSFSRDVYYGCFMTEEQEKVTGYTIDMHLVIDEQGKVKITQDLLDAFRVRPGDMLSFHFDTTQDLVSVTGRRKPPNFHEVVQVHITPITRGSPPQLSVSPTIPRLGEVVTQQTLFDTGKPIKEPPKRRRTR